MDGAWAVARWLSAPRSEQAAIPASDQPQLSIVENGVDHAVVERRRDAANTPCILPKLFLQTWRRVRQPPKASPANKLHID
jgi:hypothetical protein